MFKKVKKILGIEGVKIELGVPEKVVARTGMIIGKIKFTSLTPQLVKKVTVELIEKYSRGGKSSKLVDEYKLGSIELTEPIEVKPHQIVEVEFELPFVTAKSEMDLLGESNFIMKRMVRAAKYLRNVKSQYRVDAHAYVKGTKLNPSTSKEVKMI